MQRKNVIVADSSANLFQADRAGFMPVPMKIIAGDWLHAFGDAEEVYGVSLTSHLSGCYNAACIAAEEYMAEHPGRKVFILDSLSTGPELELLIEKYPELIEAGYAFDVIQQRIKE